jgi:glycosyltransferase involved in cell wall biosynthesis
MMMDVPLASIIIPTFNCAPLLPRALESVLAQSLGPVEVIVVDDGSTDDTPAVLARYAGRVLPIRQGNAGLSAARNRGLQRARGALVGFLDADDAYHPEKLARQAAALAARPECGWAYSDCWIEEQGVGERPVLASGRYGYGRRQALEGWLFEALLPGNFIPVHTLLVRRPCLDAAGPFDERLTRMEDFDLLLRLAARTPAVYLPEPLATYYLQPGSLSRDRARMDRDKYEVLDKVARLFPERIPRLGRTGRRAIADMHNWFAYRHLEAGNWADGVARLRASLRLCPAQGRAAWSLLHALARAGRRRRAA